MVRAIFLICILYCFALFAETPLFLWEVKGKENSVYIAGSIHILTADSYPLDARFEKAYEESEKIVCEIELDSMYSNYMQGYIMGRALYSGGKTLKSELSKEEYDLVQEMAESSGIQMFAIENFRPWYATMFITLQKLEKLGFSSVHGFDSHFYERAKEDEKLTGGLEEPKAQIDILTYLDSLDSKLVIEQSYQDLKRVETDFNDMHEAWISGNVKLMDSLINSSLKEMPEFADRLLYQRNLDWLPQIEKFLTDTIDYFVIGGAGHMTGDKGVIQLLKEKGYTPVQK